MYKLLHSLMSSLRLQDTVLLTEQYPDLSLGQVQQFISFTTRLKDDILLAQPSSVLAHNPPDVLPPTVSIFLQISCSFSQACVETWDVLKKTIWHDLHGLRLEGSLIHDFSVHGHSLGLCEFRFYATSVFYKLEFIVILNLLIT
jgi:hypothetical protein